MIYKADLYLMDVVHRLGVEEVALHFPFLLPEVYVCMYVCVYV